MKSICFIYCRKGSTWQNRGPKAKLHSTISLTFLSHPYPTVIHLPKFKSIFAFFWPLIFFLSCISEFLQKKSCCENRKSQLTTTTICYPCNFFSSFRILKKCLSEKCYSPGFFSYAGVAWLNWERACQLKRRKSLLKRRLHLLTIFSTEDFVFYLLQNKSISSLAPYSNCSK